MESAHLLERSTKFQAMLCAGVYMPRDAVGIYGSRYNLYKSALYIKAWK